MIGAIAGDVIGSVYEGKKQWLTARTADFQPLFSPKARFTDDTVLTVAVADALLHGHDLTGLPKDYYARYPGAGFGGPFYFIPMITRMQTIFRGAEIARVFRLRLAVMAASMLIFNLAATPMFDLIGPTHTEFYLGLLLLGLGLGGHLYYRRREIEPENIRQNVI